MALPRAAFRWSVLGVGFLVLVVVFLALPGKGPGYEVPTAVTARDGTTFAMPTDVGVYPARWHDVPVLVFVVPASQLDAANAAGGPRTTSIGLPSDSSLHVFVMSASSTHLGCTVSWNPTMIANQGMPDHDHDGTPGGLLMDPCSQSFWDAFHHGEVAKTAQPARERLAQLEVMVMGDELQGTAFDGPVGPQR